MRNKLIDNRQQKLKGDFHLFKQTEKSVYGINTSINTNEDQISASKVSRSLQRNTYETIQTESYDSRS